MGCAGKSFHAWIRVWSEETGWVVAFDIPDWRTLHIPEAVMDLADVAHGMVLDGDVFICRCFIVWG